MIYYNYRHYNPRDGRWISRDLIEESDGCNLYDYVKNSSLIYYDVLGNNSASLKIFDNLNEALYEAIEMVARATKENREEKKDEIYEMEYGARICCNEKGYYIPGVGTSKGGSYNENTGNTSQASLVPTDLPPCFQEKNKDQDEQKGMVHSHLKGSSIGLSEYKKNGKIVGGDVLMVANGIKLGEDAKNASVPAHIIHAVVGWADSLAFNAPHLDKTRAQERWIAKIYNGNGKLLDTKKGIVEYVK